MLGFWTFIFSELGELFWANLRKFCFLKHNEFFEVFRFLKYKKSFILRKYKKFCGVSVSWSIRNFDEADFFHFSSLSWKVQSSISGKLRKAFFWENISKAFFWENIGKVFFWENISIFLTLELESSISRNIRIFFGVGFFKFFFGLGLRSAGFHFQKYKEI